MLPRTMRSLLRLQLLLSQPLDVIEEFDEMLNGQVSAAPILFDSHEVRVHRLEAVDEVAHQDELTVAAKFEDADRQGEGLVAQTVDLSDHELHWWQPSQHRVRRVQR